MDTITTIMLSCEDKTGQIADNLRNIGKEFQAMGLVDKIAGELYLDDTFAGQAIKAAINQNKPAMMIVKTCADMLNDGWKGLSGNLTSEIKNF